jgi:hypothetical protein
MSSSCWIRRSRCGRSYRAAIVGWAQAQARERESANFAVIHQLLIELEAFERLD